MSIAEQRYRDLQSLARDSGRTTQELLTLYVLESFLCRVAQSSMRQRLILKGGVLLAAFDARRPTRDIDFSALNMNNDAQYALTVCSEIASQIHEDGVVFDLMSVSAETIRDDDEYGGVRVSMTAELHTAKISFHIDLNFADPIVPAPKEIAITRILGGSSQIILLGYPISMVLAEKIVTAIQRGTANTRWRDFGDIYNLSRRHSISSRELLMSLNKVAEHRVVDLSALGGVLSGYPEIGQNKYGNWRRKDDRHELPESFGDLLESVCTFTDPIILEGSSKETHWDPVNVVWR